MLHKEAMVHTEFAFVSWVLLE